MHVCVRALVVGFAQRSCGCVCVSAAADRWRNVVQSIAVGRRATCAISILYTHDYYFVRPTVIICKPTTPVTFDLSVNSVVRQTQNAAPGSSTRSSFVRISRSFSSALAGSSTIITPLPLPAHHSVPRDRHNTQQPLMLLLLRWWPVPRPLKL